MAFCINCGQELAEGAKFCANCGKAVNVENPTTQRKTVYEGELHKCPNCGELLEAFTTMCPSCGYELRGTNNSSSVREFAAKLEAIEAGREQRKNNPIKNLYFGQTLTKTDEQKISLIRSFAIPNTKEDLYEFLILSKSNIDVDLYENNMPLKRGDANLATSDAWKAKFEQAYQKAKLLFKNDSRMIEIQAMYDETHKSIKKAKSKVWRILGRIGIGYAIFSIVCLGIIFSITIGDDKSEAKEIARMESIVQEIEEALEDGNYRLALSNADRLVFDDGHYLCKSEKDWKIKREYWIDEVIEQAKENGVILERPTEDTTFELD